MSVNAISIIGATEVQTGSRGASANLAGSDPVPEEDQKPEADRSGTVAAKPADDSTDVDVSDLNGADDAAAAKTDAEPTAAQLKAWVTESKARHAAEAEVTRLKAELAAKSGESDDAKKLAEITKYKSEGKRLAALRAIGMDSAEEIDAILQEAMNEDTGARPSKEVLDAVAAVKAENAELKKRLDERDAADKSDDDTTSQAEIAKARTEGVGLVAAFLKKDEAKYPLCSKDPKVAEEATDDVIEAVRKMGRAVTDVEAEKMIRLALDHHEADRLLAEKRKETSDKGDPSRVTLKRTVSPLLRERASLRPAVEDTGDKRYKNPDEVKRDILERMRAKRLAARPQ